MIFNFFLSFVFGDLFRGSLIPKSISSLGYLILEMMAKTKTK
jgi:hypothetical protein